MNYVDITPEQAQELLSEAQKGLVEEYEVFAQVVTDDTIVETRELLDEDQKQEKTE